MTRSTKQERSPSTATPESLELTDAPFGSVGRQMNKILEQMQKGYYSYHPVETWTPAVNLYETATSYIVCVDLAGVQKEKIDITVVGQRLTFRGSRQVPIEPPRDSVEETADHVSHPPRFRVHLMEVDHGAFSRDVELPEDVEADQITATYRNGLLWIELPRIELPQK